MSTTITIADEISRELNRANGVRRVSDVIRAQLEARRQLAAITEAGVLDDETRRL